MNKLFKFRPGLFNKLVRPGLCILLLINVAGCVSTPTIESDDSFIASILNYEASLPQDHPDSTEQVFKLPDHVRKSINDSFKARDKNKNAGNLAQWLMDPDGHGLTYELGANLKPAQAFEQRRGNCISFTLLLLELASELDIELRVNQVDLPDIWGQDSDNDLIFYRHVNAIFKTNRKTQIFDLAMEQYKPGFPQRLISRSEATALLFSNIGIEKLKQDNIDDAIHYLNLSASVFPSNPDMWINLGAAYKRINELELAEKIYLFALSIKDKDSLAASNLERLYRKQGRNTLAERFEKLAAKGRARNPYVYFQNAEAEYKNEQYRRAAKSIKRAIQLHDQDPEFYALRSRIKEQSNKYISALKDLEKAHNVSKSNKERERYAKEITLAIARVKALNENKTSKPKNHNGGRAVTLFGNHE